MFFTSAVQQNFAHQIFAMGAKLSILLLVLFGISQVALSLKQKNRSVSQKQYAELFAPGYGYELYELTPSDGIPDADEAINSIVITKLEKEKEVLTKPPEMLDRHHRLENRAQEERIHALTRPDDSYHVMRPELMRQKRDIPAWQAAYSHRFRAYVRAKQETITPEGGRKKKKSRHVARRKFARQFDADETAPNQDDNSIEEKRNQMEQEENLDREIAVGTVEPTTVTKIRRKKNKRKTTTARTTTTTTSTTTTTTTVRTPSDDDRYDAPDDVVQDIIEDLQKKEEHPSNENVPTWARKHLESALDTRNNQELKDMIVDKHDYLRSMVSPPAADMMKMEWNEEAAKVAQWWAEQCQFKHDPGEGRHNSRKRARLLWNSSRTVNWLVWFQTHLLYACGFSSTGGRKGL